MMSSRVLIAMVVCGVCSVGAAIAAGVVAVDPPENSNIAPITTNIAATLDEPVDTGSVDANTFVAHGYFSGRIAGSYSFPAADSAALNPTADFAPGELVEASITAGVQTGGVPISPYVWRFRAAVTGGSGSFVYNLAPIGNDWGFRVELGDLDGDSDLDAFCINTDMGGGGTLPSKVFFNSGTSGFTNSGQLIGNTISMDVALGDLDGDGDLDAFIANTGPSGSEPNAVWFNDGSGGFTLNQSLGAAGSTCVDLGDLDGDGDLDAFVGNVNASSDILLNDGTGTFTITPQTVMCSSPYGIALGDIDGDGDLDVFVANFGQMTYDSNQVFFNDGTGTFTDSGQALGTGQSFSVDLGDLDGDGDLDVFVANLSLGSPPCRTYFNNGTGVFTSGQNLGTEPLFYSGCSLGDMDGDGNLDAIVSAVSSNGLILFRNTGSGTFAESGQIIGFNGGYGVATGDLDGDDDLDIYLCTTETSTDEVWLNEGPFPVPATGITGLLIIIALFSIQFVKKRIM